MYMKGDICVYVIRNFFATALEDGDLEYFSTCYSLIDWSLSSFNL
jgi:hypothetical protein